MLSNQTSASHLNNIPTNFCVYSTATNQQSDLSHTQLANQVTDTECDYYANLESPEARLNKTTECLYAKVKHRQYDLKTEGLIYSVINKIPEAFTGITGK